MNTIEMKTVYRDGDDKWEDGDGNAINVVLDDSDRCFHALLIDGVQHLVLNAEPYTHWRSYGIHIGYTCFKPSPGVTYAALFDSGMDEHYTDSEGREVQYTTDGDTVWLPDFGQGQVTERHYRNGVAVIGFSLSAQLAAK